MKYATKLVLIIMMVAILGNGSNAAAYEPIRMDNVEQLPEWEMKNSSLGGKLLLSDSPEMVENDGILYQDKVEGNVRLFFYHVNAAKTAKKMDVILENKGTEVAHVKVSKSSLGGPGYAWLVVGKETMTSYLGKTASYQINIPPGGALPLSTSISETAVLPNMLINGIYDFTVDHPINVKVMMLPILEDAIKFSQTAKVLPTDECRLRGTFEGANRKLSSVDAYDPVLYKAIGITLADNEIDHYLTGVDATDGTKVVNYGNYGVVYQIEPPGRNSRRISYYLVPLGGYYAGAIGIHHPEVDWSPMATPRGKVYFGDNKQDFSFLGTYDKSESLSFTFSPPGASNLPVKLVILSQ
ncbi:hypothetical protein [Pelosinus sp. UFO1]|uniref:hypothetical protein n=1 Tax=Pelosinus sp. UFO1 TaxID=484770 RepID=UPI0004D0C434|nr:hypothetical protein [Pelosinus sp. UFO1]AIF49747.1 hypothetical protein UFO1_0186 [Pelosinus sp. UFO1]